MLVSELIERLQELDQNMEVRYKNQAGIFDLSDSKYLGPAVTTGYDKNSKETYALLQAYY